MKVNFKDYINGNIFDISGKPALWKESKSENFFKDLVKSLKDEPVINILNFASLVLGPHPLEQFIEALQETPLPTITELDLKHNYTLDQKRLGSLGITALEKLTEQHLPNLKILSLQGCFFYPAPEKLIAIAERAKENFPKLEVINFSNLDTAKANEDFKEVCRNNPMLKGLEVKLHSPSYVQQVTNKRNAPPIPSSFNR